MVTRDENSRSYEGNPFPSYLSLEWDAQESECGKPAEDPHHDEHRAGDYACLQVRNRLVGNLLELRTGP